MADFYGVPVLNVQTITFPISKRWLARDVVHDRGDVPDFVDDSNRDFLKDVPRNEGEVCGHTVV